MRSFKKNMTVLCTACAMLVLLSLCAYVLFGQGRRKGSGKSRRQGNSNSNVSSRPSTPSINQEAYKKAKQWAEERYKKCDGLYYVVVRWQKRDSLGLYQIKYEPVVRIEGSYIPPRSLSEADRLNGVDPQPVEWEGRLFLQLPLNRYLLGAFHGQEIVFENQWGEWRDSFEFGRRMSRVKGQWTFQEAGETRENPVNFDCSDIFGGRGGVPPDTVPRATPRPTPTPDNK